jgi:hypothetical protein
MDREPFHTTVVQRPGPDGRPDPVEVTTRYSDFGPLRPWSDLCEPERSHWRIALSEYHHAVVALESLPPGPRSIAEAELELAEPTDDPIEQAAQMRLAVSRATARPER